MEMENRGFDMNVAWDDPENKHIDVETLILSESDKRSSVKMKTITMDIDLEAPTVPEDEEKETVNEIKKGPRLRWRYVLITMTNDVLRQLEMRDVSASGFENKEEILSSTEFINSGSKEKVKDSTVLDVTNGFSLSSKDNWVISDILVSYTKKKMLTENYAPSV
ncbi:hypothetical protein Tco_1429893 [Tanacetum coccineum]